MRKPGIGFEKKNKAMPSWLNITLSDYKVNSADYLDVVSYQLLSSDLNQKNISRRGVVTMVTQAQRNDE